MLRRRLDGGLPATGLMDSENQPLAIFYPEYDSSETSVNICETARHHILGDSNNINVWYPDVSRPFAIPRTCTCRDKIS
jgi:hypothetical protein